MHTIAELCKLHTVTLCLCPSKFHSCCYLPIITPTKFRLLIFNLWEISGRMSTYWCCSMHYLITCKMGHFSSWLWPSSSSVGLESLLCPCPPRAALCTMSPLPSKSQPSYGGRGGIPLHDIRSQTDLFPTIECTFPWASWEAHNWAVTLLTRFPAELFILVTSCNSHNQPWHRTC